MWEKVRLGEYVDILSGFAFKSNLFTDESTYTALIRIRDIKRGYTETFYKGEYKEEYLIHKGDFLIGMDGEFNIAQWTGKPSLLNQRVCKVSSSKPDKLDNKYLFYVLSTKLKKIEDKASFVTVKHLSVKDINSIEIPLPPLPVQQRIADILDKADTLRRKDKELLKKYDELAQAIFIDMFGDPVKNEKGWEVKKLEQLGKLDRGVSKHRPRNAPELLGGPYPLIQTGDVANSGGWIKNYKSTYSEIGLKQSKMWPVNTLCITIAANIAKTGILTFDACFPDSIVGFNSYNQTNNVFVQYWFSFFQKILEEQAPESAQKNINLAILRNLGVIAPPIKLQEAFAKKIELINALKAKTNVEKSEKLFQSLLQRPFVL